MVTERTQRVAAFGVPSRPFVSAKNRVASLDVARCV
jgi:hypothetical protein